MEMVSMSSSLLSINGNFLLSSQYPSRPPTPVKWGFRRDQDGSSVTRRIKSQAFPILANPNVSGNSNPQKEIFMVDPLEAKRLAAQQMKEIQAKERFKVLGLHVWSFSPRKYISSIRASSCLTSL